MNKYDHLREFVLDRMRFHANKRLLNVETDVYLDRECEEVVICLEAQIYAEKVCEQVHTLSLERPINWWQAFKEEYFPDWLLKRYPVRKMSVYKKIYCSRLAMYPRLPLAVPEPGPIVFRDTVNEQESGRTIELSVGGGILRSISDNLKMYSGDVRQVELSIKSIDKLRTEMDKFSDKVSDGSHNPGRDKTIWLFGIPIIANRNVPNSQARIWLKGS